MGTAHLMKLLCLFTGISVLQHVRSWTITVPTTITAVEGSCVVVPCQTQPHSRVIWYQYHKIQYPVVYDGHHPTAVENQFRGRTSVLGEAAKGNCTLTINNVKMTDNNLNIYVWINPDSKPPQRFYDQTVTIMVERKVPIISIQRQILEGEIFQANCSVNMHSCPFSPPLLRWNISSFLKDSTSMTFHEDDKGQWMHTKTLQGLATYEMHNSNMWCSAKFSTFTTESQQIPLNILYKPVTVALIMKKEPVMEGGRVIVECAANCNPQPHTYIWLRRQMGQTNEITSTERKGTFNNITRDTSLSCIAYNDIGSRKSDWLDLDVQYAPVIVPESSCHLTGDVVKCVCQAEASPTAYIHWTIDGNTPPPSFHHIVVSTNKTNVVSGEISGPAQNQSNISCTATNSLGSNVKQLSIVSSEIPALYIWLPALMLIGVGLIFGCTMFIYRRRKTRGFACDTAIYLRPENISDNVQEEQRYVTQGSQDEEAQSSPSIPESNPEVDRLSYVYDNDFEGETIVQQHQNNATAPQREGKTQPQGYCNMDNIYLNG